ncbi:MAG TPA: UDP-N-acetylglucosamine--N-acetylmuramyl-(pentapeptide) pyrophosphoryl-undecaprenol N-acetylglucosamine transferase [Phycisphaerae bacterium]|nr:UDP-N-acetylglucosamine--N-acetylmuramyl-(pentapeptide) pyrophosphoryl-undecaprenol N-acetylglucosamine transferase [Phycisphaerae bacterium]
MPSQRPWFIIAGGGTGGHLYPGLAVAESIQSVQPDFEVAIFGTARPIDRKLADARGYDLVVQDVRPFPSRPWEWPGFLAAWFRSVKVAHNRFRKRPPTMVLGLGGYAAGPPVVAAAKLGIPTAIFNPDAVPGRANRRLGCRVDRIFVQWEETAQHFPKARTVVCTGCPVRPAFASVTREQACRAIKLDPDSNTLLVTGASQGARSINAAMMELFDLWRVAEGWQIIHLTGPADLEMCREKYKGNGVDARVFAYTEHMSHCMAAADLVISRAGASTLAEITAMSLPSILMPYPFDRKKHQTANAKVLVDKGAAILVEDANDPKVNASRLRGELRDLMRSEESRRRMARCAGALGRIDAADTIAAQLFEMARG